MKKLIILLFILTGCGYNAIDNTSYVVITDIESSNDGTSKDGCYYYVHGATSWRIYQQKKSYFFDKCGKFTVGDTIYITKRP